MIIFTLLLNPIFTAMALVDYNNPINFDNIGNSLKSLTLLATLKSNYSLVNDSLKQLKVSLQKEKNKIERRTNKMATIEISESNIALLNKNIEATISIVKKSFGKIKNRNYDQLINIGIQFVPNANIRPTNNILLTTGTMFIVRDLIRSTLKYKQIVKKEMTMLCSSIKTSQAAMVTINTKMTEIINNDQISKSSNTRVLEIMIKMSEMIKNNVELSMDIMNEGQKLSEVI